MSTKNNCQIRLAAEGCENELRSLLAKCSTIDESDSRLLRDVFQQFGLWSGYLGVFAEQNISLDARLELAPDVKELILRLLDILKTDTVRVSSSASEKRRASETAFTITGVARVALEGLRPTIHRLQRLAKSIRRVSAESLEIRAQTFALKRQTGRNAKEDGADRLFERTATLFIKGLYPNITASLQQQLLSSIKYRRLRLMSHRRHQMKLEHNAPNSGGSQPSKPEEPAPGNNTQGQATYNYVHDRPAVVTNSPQPKPDIEAISNTVPTEAPGPIKIPFSSDFQDVPRALTLASIDPGHYPYPERPKFPEGAIFCKCPWCGDLLDTVQIKDTQFWKSHVKTDMRPYSCISEKCSDSRNSFVTFKEWRRHMDEFHGCDWPQTIHKPRVWFCDLDDNKCSPFRTAEALRDHFSHIHPQANFNESQKSLKSRLNVLSIARKPNICPICNENIKELSVVPSSRTHEAMRGSSSAPKSGKRKRKVAFATSGDKSESDSSHPGPDGALEDGAMDTAEVTKTARHIGDHLKSLAFLSIRYLDEADDEEEEKSHTGQAADSDEAGSHFSKLSFEDVPPDERASPVLTRHELQLPCHVIKHSRNPMFSDTTGMMMELMDRELLPPKEETPAQQDRLRDPGAAIRAFLIWGNSIGKTEIALEYAHSRKDKFDAIFWMDGSTTAELNRGFEMIARTLGLHLLGAGEDRVAENSPEEVKQLVHRWLANPVCQSESDRTEQSLPVKWLIVFDNVAEQAIRSFWPPSRCSHGAVVMTSRNPLEKPKFPGLTSGILLRLNLDRYDWVPSNDSDMAGYGHRPRERTEYFGMW